MLALFVCLSGCCSVHLSACINRVVCLLFCLYVFRSGLSVCLSVLLFLRPLVCLSFSLSVWLFLCSFICLYYLGFLRVVLSLGLSVCLSVFHIISVFCPTFISSFFLSCFPHPVVFVLSFCPSWWWWWFQGWTSPLSTSSLFEESTTWEKEIFQSLLLELLPQVTLLKSCSYWTYVQVWGRFLYTSC